MLRNRIHLFVVGFVVCTAVAGFGQKSHMCGTVGHKFTCSKEYSTVLTKTSLFITKAKEFDFRVFLSDGDQKDEKIRQEIASLIFPDWSTSFEWKELELQPGGPASKYETARHRWLGFNGMQLLTVDIRHFSKGSDRFVTGVMTPGEETGDAARTAFDNGNNLSTGGCFEALRITRLITGERESSKYDPCTMTITVGGRN